ncbi:MAG: tripartite tricarboxylate transporter TctB family protein [Granulosicoccus sp.]
MQPRRLVTLQALFKRYRRPGDIVFALIFLVLSLWLLSQLNTQTTWKNGGKLVAQAPFWPTVSIVGMVFFASLHTLGSVLSARIPGRWTEVAMWLRSIEFAVWFMAYVFAVPVIGYLLATLLVCSLLARRVGYRSRAMLSASVLGGGLVVVIFKSLLQVKVPGGTIYEYLPGTLRSFMLTYF